MNYYNRLTSLLLGEASYPKEGSGPGRDSRAFPPDPRLKSPVPEIRRAAANRREGEVGSAEAAYLGRVSSNKSSARRMKLHTKYKPGVNPAKPVPEIPQTLDQFKRDMANPRDMTTRASLGSAGRRSKK